MSSTARRSFFGGSTSEENARILADPNVSYRLLYWNIASVGATARDILAFGKAKWSNQFPEGNEWREGKLPTPFKVMPVLNIISPDLGKDVFITESIVIDNYLAKKFNLLGSNDWEELTIRGIYSNIHYLRERSLRNVTWTYQDKRGEGLATFMTITLPNFIADHEFHLRENGSNGHYVGDKLSLADIHLANVMDHLSHLPSSEATNELFKKSELWKVKETVEQNPDIAAWRATEECKLLVGGSIACYAQTVVSST